LLIGSIEGGKVIPEFYERRICRLAGGFSVEEGLAPDAQKRTLAAFTQFADICRTHQVQKVRAVGTAAFRQAKNGEAFAETVRSTTRLPLEIISGDVEAETMTLGVLSALDPLPSNALIIDIGGGSTEFVLCKAGNVLWSRSVPLGVVHLIEGYGDTKIRQDVIAAVLSELSGEIKSVCMTNHLDTNSITLVGTAGTVTTLAALDQQMTDYDWKLINNYTMHLARLLYWQSLLAPLSVSEREAFPGMEAGRGDLILAGIEILLCLMQQLDCSSLTVSDFGILEGLLFSLQSTE
jgi:exopolyphosphatase/guanosine-5'-triphosphate,3'-diphosphate pyrophosphatase